MNSINMTVEKLIGDKNNNDECQIIKENYHSSPKCGIKALFVKKRKNNIIFTPIEISAKPYFIYCVTQIKEEQNNDISQSETNQTKANDYKNTNTNNFDSSKVLKINKTMDKEDEEKGKESEETDYIHIIEKKASEITVSKSFNCLEEHKNVEKDKKIRNSSKFLKAEKVIKKVYTKSLNDNESKKLKMKLSLKKIDAHHKTTLHSNKITIYNILNNIKPPKKLKYNNNNENKLIQTESNLEMIKTKSIFSNKSNSKKNKNGKKVLSPKSIVFKPQQVKIEFSHSNNIKRIKKAKKTEKTEKEMKINKKKVKRQYSFIPNFKIKKNKIKLEENNIKIEEKDEPKTRRNSMILLNEKKEQKTRRHSMLPLNESKNNSTIKIEEKDEETRRHSMLPLNENKKKSKKIYNNILNKNRKETRSNININKTNTIGKKMKNSVDRNNRIQFKYVGNTKRFDYEKCNTPKRRLQYNYKTKGDEFFIDLDSIKIQDNSSKKNRKVSISLNNISGSKKKLKNSKEDSRVDIQRAKKSIFFILKDKDKDKDKSKDIDKGSVKEKKYKKKRKKKNKQKEDKEDKDKNDKKDKGNEQPMKKKPFRKDKSFSIKSSKINNDLTNDCSEKNNSLKKIIINNEKYKIYCSNEKKEKNENENNNSNNDNNNNNNRTDVRGNSTKNLYRDNHNREKIIALTNKQTINNINEYTRQCLRMIPDLYDLKEKMPRCKAKINPDFSKDKKIALFDLDETIVHCIGEINMNNLESLSLQSDAKIKVHLPGGKREVTVGINIRPHWEEALKRIKEKYHIIAFTASHESYADSVLNYLDPEKKYFEYRLYRCHCVFCIVNGVKFYVKDLKLLEDNYDLKDLVLIDNSVLSFAYRLDNGIPISPFYDSKNDTELLTIADFLLEFADVDDIRNQLKEVYKLTEYYEILKDYSSSEENEESSDSSMNEKDKNLEKNKTNNSSNDNDNDINLKNLDMNKSKDNADLHLGKAMKKNISQINLKLKEISNYFDNEENKEKRLCTKNPTIKISGSKRFKYEKKNCLRKIKGKHKTILLDINFQKEWDEKQKELKNKK